jgi:hypothetical protein
MRWKKYGLAEQPVQHSFRVGGSRDRTKKKAREMSSIQRSDEAGAARTRENIAYIRQMLGELRLVAKSEGADMLCYLIEMAYVEAGDIQTGRSRLKERI